ncbi:hypothetical protein R1flu_013952 [Riccia fluitans]|uniref:Uncharacterized protein n=1 Tax=Riccia fluitans TaxID=41844 RepID=A0ABD1YER0_9MARC
MGSHSARRLEQTVDPHRETKFLTARGCSACPWAQLSSSTSELRTTFSVPAKSRGSVSSKQSRTTRIQEDLKRHRFLLSMILFKAILMDGDGIAGKISAVRHRVGG